MNSSGMMTSMNASMYLDSNVAGTSAMNRRGGPLPTTTVKPKLIRFMNSTQTGKNVSKVRWLLEENDYFSVPDPFATEYFVSGSWSWVKEDNDLRLFCLEVSPSVKEGEKDSKVTLIDKLTIPSSVAGISALPGGRFCCCSSDGMLYNFKCEENMDGKYASIDKKCYKELTTKNGKRSSASAIAAKDGGVIVVGEDGSIFECSETLDIIRSLVGADPLSISSVCLLSRNEILTGNGGGQLKLWDLRTESTEPVQILNPNVLMNNLYGVSSICQHPTQTHAIIVGYQSGCLDLWDLRMGPNCDPVANLASEGGSLSEIYFHQVNPDHFFSCAQSGQVCHWYPADRLSNPLQMPLEYTTDLNIEFLKRGLVFKEIHISPFPINSISLSKNDRVVAGSDSGGVFCTEIRV